MVRQIFDLAGQYSFSILLLIGLNSLQPLFAANPDSDYKDALALFEKRDIVSRIRAITILEKNLETKADHLDSQALISYAYAHEAYVMSQVGEPATEYQNSADAFSKAVLAQQPQNLFARKTVLFLQLVAGNHVDARKTLERDVTEKENDADMWYMLAAVSEGDKANRSLVRALTLNPDHVWIYSDMAFRALKMGDVAVAEKWIKALEARRPGVPEADLLRAIVAANKKDKKRAKEHWTDFARKAPDSVVAAKFGSSGRKKSSKG